MKIKNSSLIIIMMAVFVTGSVFADIFASDGAIVRRLSPDGALVWQDTAGARSTSNITLGADDQLMFLSREGTDRMVTTKDAYDGSYYDDRFKSGTHMVDCEWGPDYNNDGKADLYVSGRQELWVVDVTINALDDVVYVELADFTVSDANSLDPTGSGGTGGQLFFGPDMNADGTGDLFSMKGGNVSPGNRINVWDPMTGTQIASYAANECKGISDAILGPDQNGDGQEDLWVCDRYRNSIRAYDLNNAGAYIGAVDIGGITLRSPNDIVELPDGTIYTCCRFGTELSTGGVASSYTNIIKYVPATNTATQIFEEDGNNIGALAYTPIELEPYVEIIPEPYDIIVAEYADVVDPNSPLNRQFTRLDNGGGIIWQSNSGSRSVSNMTLTADEQFIFMAKQGTDKMLVGPLETSDGTYNGGGSNRFNSGTHMIDCEWGPDYNSDGKVDLYASGRNDIWVLDVDIVAMNQVVYTTLAQWTVADNDANSTGTGGNLVFGPDMNADGVGDLFATKGGNSAGNRINVWDSMTGAKIVTYTAEECRGIGDGAFVNDQNRDGIADLWVADAYRDSIRTYDGANGSYIGTVGIAGDIGSAQDLEMAPDGTIYIVTRFKSSLNASYADPTSDGADVIRHNPSTGESWLVASVDGGGASGRFGAVAILSTATCPLDSVADLDDDCDVDIDDLTAFVGQWLMSTDPAP